MSYGEEINPEFEVHFPSLNCLVQVWPLGQHVCVFTHKTINDRIAVANRFIEENEVPQTLRLTYLALQVSNAYKSAVEVANGGGYHG